MNFKQITRTTHKILGLTSGIVVFIVAITGAMWAFKDEIKGLKNGYKNVAIENKSVLSPSEVKELAYEIYPDISLHGTVYNKPGQAIEAIYYQEEPLFYQSAYLNPYSGELLHIEDHLSGFFAFVLDGHMYLWLPHVIGEQVVGISILVFLVMVLSGIILWWPKKRKHLGQRLKFQWKSTTRWRRKNFDLHSIVGFYACLFALIFAVTGLAMSYDWFQSGLYSAIGGQKNVMFLIPESEEGFIDASDKKPIDRLLPKLWRTNPQASSFEIHYPHSATSSIYVEVSNTDGVYYNSDYLFFDQNTLAPVPSETIYRKYKEMALSDKVLRMNYDIHVGAIAGIPGKILAFLISILIASLPVTGFLIYWGKHKKKVKAGKNETVFSLE
ncbi:PepSY domain-containing protein [Flagellimonas sp. HMM57]|uniref:PepSY-associated TM helix domain-containing protein n=1 Tax=unclassified Flagellimonas TaxID=2644544 RepID=UPI0013D4C710|nr:MULTISPECIES: PepSY-associated TM helix domain-containing protein [unclassified Flagellimonas]UII77070.1 PepSY domain-containing protein [Flagellimonas sp. HMM57]